jgi:hypothetical protein
MINSNLSKESTYYQYKLIKKINYSTPILSIYFGLFTLFLLSTWLFFGLKELLALLISGIALQGLYALLIIVIYSAQGKRDPKQWGYGFNWLWFGYIPKQLVSISFVNSLHWQLLILCTAVILSLTPWTSPLFVALLLMVHIWSLLPRLYILTSFAHYKKSGLLKISSQDSSFYTQ